MRKIKKAVTHQCQRLPEICQPDRANKVVSACTVFVAEETVSSQLQLS